MGVMVFLLKFLNIENQLLLLIIQICSGVMIYILLCYFTKNDSFMSSTPILPMKTKQEQEMELQESVEIDQLKLKKLEIENEIESLKESRKKEEDAYKSISEEVVKHEATVKDLEEQVDELKQQK